MQAYSTMQKPDVVVIPVQITYDHVFEVDQLAREVAESTDAAKKQSLLEIFNKLRSNEASKSIGRVYVTFG